MLRRVLVDCRDVEAFELLNMCFIGFLDELNGAKVKAQFKFHNKSSFEEQSPQWADDVGAEPVVKTDDQPDLHWMMISLQNGTTTQTDSSIFCWLSPVSFMLETIW